jgi:allantoinase
VTTIVDMPLNSVPATTTVAALDAKRRAAAGKCHVDVGFWGGVVPGNAADLEPLVAAGVLGFKCFLVPSGVDEFRFVTEIDLREAMPILTTLGAPLLAHAELSGPIDAAIGRMAASDPRQYATYLATRPAQAENEAIALLIALCRELGTRTHIVHLASSEALPMLDEARALGLPITSESCPHYLTFAAEEIGAGATAFKCAPPIRERDHRERLWTALMNGSIQLVASDHSPSPPVMKHLDSGDFLRAWGGIASLQVALPAVWTGASARGGSLDQLAAWMCRAPARLAGLMRKGEIAPGYDADLVIWDPEAELTVDAALLEHRHKITPYDGRRLRGAIERTYLRGRRVYERGQPFPAPSGQLLSRLQTGDP